MQFARSIGEIRQAWGSEWADASDEEVLQAYSKATGSPLAQIAGRMGYDPGRGSMNRERMSASVDNYQGNLYDVAEHASRAVGANSPADFFARQRTRNQVQAQIASERARNLGAVDSYTDVDSLGDFGNYVAGLGIQSLPYMGEAIAGGVAARAAMTGTRAALSAGREMGMAGVEQGARAALARGSTAGAVGASYPSAVGDILQSQRDQADTTDFGDALTGGVPYAALNAFGVEGVLSRGALFRNSVGALDRVGGARGALTRVGATGVATGLKEGASEVGQEAANQYFGRMAVDPNETFWNPESQGRFAESFVGGGVLGGTVGAAAGGWRRSAGYHAPVDLTRSDADLLQGDSGRPDFALQPPAEQFGPEAPMAQPPVQGADPNQVEMFMPNGAPTYNADPSFGFGFDLEAGGESAPRDPRAMHYPTERAPVAPGSEIPPIGWDGDQQDLFNLHEAPLPNAHLFNQPGQEDPVADAGPAFDPRQGDIFADRPTATVQTDFAPHQLVRELRQANDGKADPYVMKLSAGLSKSLGNAEATEKFLADEQEKLFSSRAGRETTERRQRVFDAAMGVADRYKQRITDAMAQEGAARAKPGVRVGAEPKSVTADAMRDRNRRDAVRAATAEVDARVQATRDAQVAASRRAVLDDILGDEKTANPTGRFTAELKRRNLPNVGITDEEKARIKRFEDARAAFTESAKEPAKSPVSTPASPLKGAADESAKPDATSKYDGVSVSLKAEVAGKARTLNVKDAGKKLRELDAKASKYEQLLKCLTG